jgi:Flagellar transcriptional activator (FlhD)
VGAHKNHRPVARTRVRTPSQLAKVQPTTILRPRAAHAHPPVCPLKDIQAVNERCLEILMEAARADPSGALPLVKELGDVLRQMTPVTRERAARRPFLLVDMELGNGELWRCLKSHPRRSVRLAGPRGAFPRPQAVRLARAVLTMAWSSVRADRHAARVFLGMSAAVADVLMTLSLTEIDRIAVRQFRLVRPRWEDRADVWRKILEASQTPDIRRARDVNLRGLQLIAGALVSPPGPST